MVRARALVLVGIVVALLGLSWAADLTRYASLDGMRALVAAYDPYGPFVYMGVCIAGMFLYLPPLVLIALGGMLFGIVPAFAFGWVGCLLGATGTFLLVRYLARDEFQRRLGERFVRVRALDERLAHHGFTTMLVLRLVLFLSPPLNWALGASRVRTHHYVGGTALGIVPGMAATVFFADSFAHVSEPISSARLLIAVVVVLAVLSGAALAGRRLMRGSRMS
jgi:uncharacterized membrane protein YdjX (TVP38/TMEM64 family)